MKTFAATIIATVVAARGTAGGINQGYANPSFGATHGYGYNEGNGYLAGDSHGHTLDLRAHGAADSNAYDVKNYFEANTHIWGYDSVAKKHTTDTDLEPNTALLADLEGALDAVQVEREAKIQAELENRIYRLGLAFEAHQEKAEAPFIYQDDMLLQEIDDIKVAMSHAEDDQDDAFADLIERMTDFYNAKVLEFDSETDKIVRALDRAVRDSKDVGDVFYAMRIEWLQGVQVFGTNAAWSDDVWDKKSQLDGTFDMFTFDIGKGKGHGHTSSRGYGNDRETGFVVGQGGSGDISTLPGRPVPKDGTRRRYDRATQSGFGGPNKPSDYAVGLINNQAQGTFGYNQAADLKVTATRQARPTRRASPPRRPQGGRRQMRRPRQQPERRPVRRASPTRRIPERQSTYSDYAPVRGQAHRQ